MKTSFAEVVLITLLVTNLSRFQDRGSVDASCKKKSCKKQIVAIETKKTVPVPYPVPVVVHKTKYKTRYKPGKPQVIIASIQKRKSCGCNNCCPIPIPIPVPSPTIMPSTTIDYADYYQTVDENGNPVASGLLDYYGTITDYYDYGKKKKRKRK